MKHIILTGSGGLVGGELLRQIAQTDEFTVTAVTTKPEKVHAILPSAVCVDYQQIMLPNAMDGADMLIHCGFSRSNTPEELAKSIMFTAELFLQAAQYPRMTVVNISSRSLYGGRPAPWTESMQPAPKDAYAHAKHLAERLSLNSGIKRVTSLRLGALISSALPERLPNKMIAGILNGNPIRIMGGDQQFAYMDVRDAAGGILSFMRNEPEVLAPAYNLGSERVINLKEMADIIAALAKEQLGREIPIEYTPKDIVLHDGMNCHLLKESIGWEPTISLEDALRDIFRDSMAHIANQ